jgi:hypothetical protein
MNMIQSTRHRFMVRGEIISIYLFTVIYMIALTLKSSTLLAHNMPKETQRARHPSR